MFAPPLPAPPESGHGARHPHHRATALAPFTPADTDAVYAACQDPDIQRWTVVPSPYERQHAEDFLGRIVPDGWRTGYDLDFAVLPRAGGPLVGAIGVRGHSGVWEIGFWTAKEHRGNGYATEAVVALARWTFTTTGCTRLVWRAEVGNTGSRAVAEKVASRWRRPARGPPQQGHPS